MFLPPLDPVCLISSGVPDVTSMYPCTSQDIFQEQVIDQCVLEGQWERWCSLWAHPEAGVFLLPPNGVSQGTVPPEKPPSYTTWSNSEWGQLDHKRARAKTATRANPMPTIMVWVCSENFPPSSHLRGLELSGETEACSC